jgi:hypothetical protein
MYLQVPGVVESKNEQLYNVGRTDNINIINDIGNINDNVNLASPFPTLKEINMYFRDYEEVANEIINFNHPYMKNELLFERFCSNDQLARIVSLGITSDIIYELKNQNINLSLYNNIVKFCEERYDIERQLATTRIRLSNVYLQIIVRFVNIGRKTFRLMPNFEFIASPSGLYLNKDISNYNQEMFNNHISISISELSNVDSYGEYYTNQIIKCNNLIMIVTRSIRWVSRMFRIGTFVNTDEINCDKIDVDHKQITKFIHLYINLYAELRRNEEFFAKFLLSGYDLYRDMRKYMEKVLLPNGKEAIMNDVFNMKTRRRWYKLSFVIVVIIIWALYEIIPSDLTKQIMIAIILVGIAGDIIIKQYSYSISDKKWLNILYILGYIPRHSSDNAKLK